MKLIIEHKQNKKIFSTIYDFQKTQEAIKELMGAKPARPVSSVDEFDGKTKKKKVKNKHKHK